MFTIVVFAIIIALVLIYTKALRVKKQPTTEHRTSSTKTNVSTYCPKEDDTIPTSLIRSNSPNEAETTANEESQPQQFVSTHTIITATTKETKPQTSYTPYILCKHEGYQNGELAEYDVIRILKDSGIPPETIFHNLYVAKTGGKYAQVDVVVPIDVGVLVFEIKDYKGWIFGNANNKYWTQVKDYGKTKCRFFNPIIQNLTHINALQNQQEQLFRVPFFSIIVFSTTAKIKNKIDLPGNTFIIYPYEIPELIKYIRSKYNPAPYKNKWAVLDVFQECVENGKRQEVVAKHNLRLSQYKYN